MFGLGYDGGMDVWTHAIGIGIGGGIGSVLLDWLKERRSRKASSSSTEATGTAEEFPVEVVFDGEAPIGTVRKDFRERLASRGRIKRG